MEIQLVRERLVLWLRQKVSEAGARGLVVGLSGGVDSAVVAALAKEAFPQNSLAVWMPCQSSDADARDAEKVARTVGIPLITVALDRIWEELVDRLNDALASQETVVGCDRGAWGMAAVNGKPLLRTHTHLYHG